MLALPSQSPGLAERVCIRRAQLDRAAWTIDRAGRRLSGAAAINRVMAEIPFLRPFARLYPLPGVRQAEQLGYAWFARNRGRFARWGAMPACARPGADCEWRLAGDGVKGEKAARGRNGRYRPLVTVIRDGRKGGRRRGRSKH